METINYKGCQYEVVRGKFSIVLQILKGEGVKQIMFSGAGFEKKFDIEMGIKKAPKKPAGEPYQLKCDKGLTYKVGTWKLCDIEKAKLSAMPHHQKTEFRII